jgi:hypothetical protein
MAANFSSITETTAATFCYSGVERIGNSSDPIHLLAYIKSSPMFPADYWIPVLNIFLDDYTDPQPFSHVWVFDTNSQEIKFNRSMKKP